MESEADADTTGTILDRLREKLQVNLGERSLAQQASQSCICPFGNEECFGHLSIHFEKALQEILREEWWGLKLSSNQITSKWTHRLSQENHNTHYSLNRYYTFLPFYPVPSIWNLFFLPVSLTFWGLNNIHSKIFKGNLFLEALSNNSSLSCIKIASCFLRNSNTTYYTTKWAFRGKIYWT